ALFSSACPDPATASCKTSKRSTAPLTIVPRPRGTRPAWPTSTPPTSASSCCSKCCWTSATRSRPQPRPAKAAATRWGPIRSPRSKPSIALPNSAEETTPMIRSMAAGLLCVTLAACGKKADLVVTGGVLWTGLSHGAPRPGAVAIAGGKILGVGESTEVARLAGSRTAIVPARGGLVVPGFTDGHTHFIDGGFQLAYVDLRD